MMDKPYLWHPIFVHFSVALLTVGTVSYWVALFGAHSPRRDSGILFARWNLWLGIVAAVFTAGFGFLAFATVPHEDNLHASMVMHRNLALCAAVAYAVVGLWAYHLRKSTSRPPTLFALGLLMAFGLLIATAFAGGELVFQHGLGVSSAPTKLEPGHEHHHSHEHH